jgi:hypothetical protein
VRYVDAGYAVALATLAAYAVSLVARRRRWERAYEASDSSPYSDPGLEADALEADALGADASAVRREES